MSPAESLTRSPGTSSANGELDIFDCPVLVGPDRGTGDADHLLQLLRSQTGTALLEEAEQALSKTIAPMMSADSLSPVNQETVASTVSRAEKALANPCHSWTYQGSARSWATWFGPWVASRSSATWVARPCGPVCLAW